METHPKAYITYILKYKYFEHIVQSHRNRCHLVAIIDYEPCHYNKNIFSV
jgi:hypothetical protein